jgi:hypothetical protein
MVFNRQMSNLPAMKKFGKLAVCVAGGLLHVQAQALTSDSAANPYASIVDRNVFGLRPPPPPTTEAPKPVNVPNITLQGVISGFGKKQVLFKTMMPGAPGQPPKETSVVMSEGERLGEVEVLEINEAAGTIKFKNHGTEEIKDLSKDGVKQPTGPAPAMAGLPGVPSPAVPSVPNALTSVPPGGSGVTTFGGNAGNVAIPNRPVRTTPSASGIVASGTHPPEARPMSLEEQTVLIEVQRKLTAEKVQRGELPPLPPTDLNPNP